MFDIIIRNGRIVDGSGSPWYSGDVGIRGERIAAIGNLRNAHAGKIIDAADRIVCPGFMDMHTHSDVMMLADPVHAPKLLQGVTTEVIGLDGLSYAPLSPDNLAMMRTYLAGLNGAPDIDWGWQTVGEFLDRFHRRVSTNVAYLLPHNALRLETMGFADRQATAEELGTMQRMIEQGMMEGAVGFSTGLDYFPGRYGDTNELEAICKTVADCGGVSVWHVRNRDLGAMPAIDEALAVGEATGVKVHFSHFAANGPANKGKAGEMLRVIDSAREKGLEVTFDAYPYDASSTMILITLPGWAQDGGPTAIMERLKDPDAHARICRALTETESGWERLAISRVATQANRKYVGQRVPDAAAQAGKEIPQFICDLLLEENLDVGYVSYSGNEEDLRIIMQHPCHTTCSDGILVGDLPNPRGWGTFPRFLAKYCRELELLSFEEMIRHMTSGPAQILGLSDRGLIKTGLAADLVVFDPNTVADTATFDEPKNHPVGIDTVLVNGAVAAEKGVPTGVLNGQTLRRA
jgi:N-acyl-D-amino-acid deacylase